MRKIFILILFSSTALFAEKYIINSVLYTVDGFTHIDNLKHYMDLEIGEKFETTEDFETYLQKTEQRIKNNRVFLEGEVLTTLSDSSDGYIGVDLEIKVKDSWNIVILPYPQYDSNTGLSLGFRIKDYNFLGSMKTLSVDIDYVNLDDGGTEYYLGTDFSIPFYTGDIKWTINFAEELVLFPDDPVKNKTKLGISTLIPILNLDFYTSLSQIYYLNQDGDEDPDGHYWVSVAETGPQMSFGDITYSPKVILTTPYKLDSELSDERTGNSLKIKHNIGYGVIDLIGNFKKGYNISLDQAITYNLETSESDIFNKLVFLYHKNFNILGFSSRVLALYSSSEDETLGSATRGISNDRITDTSGVVINLDLPINFPLGPLGRWFDAQFSPFLDMAFSASYYDLSENDFWYGGGFEGFAYLKASRSVYMRGSLGIDLKELFEGKNILDDRVDDAKLWELKIVIGHHY